MLNPSFFYVIYYSFHTFEGNYIELRETIKQYLTLAASDEALQSSEKYMEINLYGSREITRRFHNYVASWFSIREHSYRIKKKIERSELKQDSTFVDEYKNQVSLYFKNNIENKFVQELRNYTQHNQLPIPSLTINMNREEDDEKINLSCSFTLSCDELLQKGEWSSTSKIFLQNQKKSFALNDLIEGHFYLTKDFYLWIRFRESQLNPYSPLEFKNATFEEWKNIVGK